MTPFQHSPEGESPPSTSGPGSGAWLSVIAPCYNESEVIRLFYAELRAVLDSLTDLHSEMIFVDDGSVDDTLLQLNEIARQDPAVRVASLSRNFGHQVALTAGLDLAAGDAVIFMDCDLQHPPSLIPELVRSWREGYDVVSAVRESTQGGSWYKDLTSSVFYKVLNLLSSIPIERGAGDFCLLSRRMSRSLQEMPERHRFLRGMISWAGFKRKLVPYRCGTRAAGQSKYSIGKMIALALDAVFSFSSQPLQLALRVGLLVAFSGFIYLMWNLIKGFVTGNMVPGYASLIGVTVTLGGCQLAFIGLIGHYLARVFEEVKRRPMYFLKQTPPESLRRQSANAASASGPTGTATESS